MNPEWYLDFFEGITLEFWDKVCGQEQTESEVSFLERVLEVSTGARLLDVPCGPGRHLAEFARRGYSVTGVDVSSESIAMARSRTRQSGAECELLHADMRALRWSSRFDGAYCFGNSFGYLDFQGTRDFLESVSKALKPDAAFVLETGMAAESILPSLDERNWYSVGDILMLMENDYVVEESRLDTAYSFVAGSRVETRLAHHYIFTISELRRMFLSAGLVTKGLFRSLDLEPFQVAAPNLYLLARKSQQACSDSQSD